MPNNLTETEGFILPNVSLCEDNDHLHYNPLCPRLNYYIISNVTYSPTVDYDETTNTISFDYEHVTSGSSCTETSENGSDSIELGFEENNTDSNIAYISSINYHGTEIPYYFTHLCQKCDEIRYVANSKSSVNASVFANPGIASHTYDSNSKIGIITFNGNLTAIPANAFYYNKEQASQITEYIANFTSVTIPTCVTSIGNYAFYKCSNLTNIDIPNSVTSIGNGAFQNCSGLTSVTIGNGVTSIGGYAFSGCIGLTSVTIPNSVTSIEYGAFSGCSGVTSVTIGNGVTSIEQNAFSGCSGLTSVHISDIAAWCNIAFSDGSTSNPLPFAHHLYLNNEEITNLVIPNSVTNIKYAAFQECTGLTSVVIPDSVTSIGGSAFYNCSNLTSVTVEQTTPPTLSTYVFDNTNNTPIYVPRGSVSAYKAANNWSVYKNRIQAIQ